MKAIPPVLSGFVRRLRIIYDGERGLVDTEAVSNGCVVSNVSAGAPADLPTNDNRRKTVIERW